MTINNCVGEIQMSYKPSRKKQRKVVCSDDTYQLLRKLYDDGTINYKEYFKVLYLDNQLNTLGWCQIAEGGISDCPVDVRVIMQAALLCNASCLILSHNHPSGNTTPSRQDKEVTKKIADASRVMGLKVIDHIILTDESYLSFQNEGLL